MNNFSDHFSNSEYEFLEYYVNNNLSHGCREIFPNNSVTSESLCTMDNFKVVDIVMPIIYFFIQEFYLPLHGCFALSVCFLGIIFNTLVIIVLMQKTLRSNPINLILSAIAVADCLLLVEYIPFTFHMYLLDEKTRHSEERFSYGWGVFLLFHSNFTITIHTVSIWLTLSLAFWRLIMIRFPSEAITMCTLDRCKIVLILGFGEFI